MNKHYTYDIDFEIDGYYSCESYGCNDDGICRCYTINNVIINNIDINSITKNIFDQFFNTKSKSYHRDNKLSLLINGYSSMDENMYCIDRILRINKLYNTDNWKSSWGGNYYGDELNDISMIDDVYNKIYTNLVKVFSLNSLSEKIEYILILEYGYLLDKIKCKSYDVLEVDKKDIVFGQNDYKEKLEKDKCEYYSDKNYNLIRGVCLMDGDKWRILDGYHRMTKTKREKIKIIGIS